MNEITFFVPGTPVPKGSAMAFIVRNGQPNARAVVVQTNRKKQKPWASIISVIAIKHFKRPTSEPVGLSLAFELPRPKNHYRSNGELKPNAPWMHAKRPDLDKLVRCVMDALTGIVYNDDSQVWEHHARKIYSDRTGVEIVIEISN